MILFISGILVGIVLFIFICKVLFTWLRPKFPVKVNCWFCNYDCVVPYGNKNCWDCPKCDQYNGFKEDGDYNKPVPAQYSDRLNFPAQCQPDKFYSTADILCNDCNLKQLLKTRLKANFIPTNEANFVVEVEEYEKQIENSQAYLLCPSCQNKVAEEIWRQDKQIYDKLQRANLSNLSQSSSFEINRSTDVCNSPQDITSSSPLDHRVFGLMALFCSVILALVALHKNDKISATFTPLIHLFIPQTMEIVVSGLIFSIIAKLYLGKDRLAGVDGLHCPLWMIILIMESGYSQSILGVDRSLFLLINSIFNTINVIINLLCLVINRKSRTSQSQNIKRCSLDSNTNSRLSDVTNTSVPVTSVSEQAERINRTQSSENLKETSTFQKVNLFLDDTLTELGSFTLGSPKPKRSDSGVFSKFSSQSESLSGSLNSIPSSLQKPRPLISPAKLHISHIKTSTPIKASHLTQVHPKGEEKKSREFGSRNSLFKKSSVVRGPVVNNMSFKPINPATAATPSYHGDGDDDTDYSRSTHSSLCPVDSTTQIDFTKKYDSPVFWKNPGVIGFVLGSSFVFNLFMGYLYLHKS